MLRPVCIKEKEVPYGAGSSRHTFYSGGRGHFTCHYRSCDPQYVEAEKEDRIMSGMQLWMCRLSPFQGRSSLTFFNVEIIMKIVEVGSVSLPILMRKPKDEAIRRSGKKSFGGDNKERLGD